VRGAAALVRGVVRDRRGQAEMPEDAAEDGLIVMKGDISRKNF